MRPPACSLRFVYLYTSGFKASTKVCPVCPIMGVREKMDHHRMCHPAPLFFCLLPPQVTEAGKATLRSVLPPSATPAFGACPAGVTALVGGCLRLHRIGASPHCGTPLCLSNPQPPQIIG